MTETYKSREWTPGELEHIRRTSQQFHSMEPRELPVKWREFTVRDTSECPHTTGTMFEVHNAHGYWGIIICNDCGGIQGGPECPHVHCTWHFEDTVLICDNCGIDGT